MEKIKILVDVFDPLNAAVKELFGFSYLFPYQKLVITNILEAAEAAGIPVSWPQGKTCEKELSDRECLGRQIVILPTGAGKSLCFQLPAMLMEGLTLVIYPILSLMADQQRHLQKYGFSPVILRGGQSVQERDSIWEKLETGQCKFIIANPEVLLTEQVKEHFKKIKINHLVIDEAHCVSEWGESFRPGYLEISSIIKSMNNPPLVTAFTATASALVLEKIRKYIFGELEARQIAGNPDRANICYSAQGCFNRDLAVRDLLIKNLRPAIVFCSSRTGTEKIARYLRLEFAEMGMMWRNEIRFYHAGLSREEKTQTEKWFMTNTEAVLCATCAYGMGVDKADIRTVIHRDYAPSVEAYLQEAGRAGRDGGQSRAILLWGPDDDISLVRAGGNENRSRVQSLLNYARDTDHCRRYSLLALLNYDSSGEVPKHNCCDVCEKRSSKKLREEETIIKFFSRNKKRFTCDEAASVLSNAKTIRWSSDEVSHAIAMLINSSKLKKIKNFLFKNKITT
jgi:ATP-dependent DNA helicase RecQ